MQLTDSILGAGIGVIMALILALPALVGEFRRRKHDHIILPDIHTWKGRKLKDREVFSLGLLIHLATGLLFGLIYPLTASLRGWPFFDLPHYSVLAIGMYAIGFYLLMNLVVFPLLGFGVLGHKEDKWIWLELIVTMALMTIGYEMIVEWFQPSWFS